MSKKGTGGNVAGKTDGTIGVGKTFDTPDYPSTITFASSSDENKSLTHSGAMSRRPGGSMRGTKWHTKDNSPKVNEPIFGKNGCPGKSSFKS